MGVSEEYEAPALLEVSSVAEERTNELCDYVHAVLCLIQMRRKILKLQFLTRSLILVATKVY